MSNPRGVVAFAETSLGGQLLSLAAPIERVPGEEELLLEKIDNASTRVTGNGNRQKTGANLSRLVSFEHIGGEMSGAAIALVNPHSSAEMLLIPIRIRDVILVG